MSAEKVKGYDLSNVGGRPKDWIQRGAEYDADFSWWADIRMALCLLGLPLLICAGLGVFLLALSK